MAEVNIAHGSRLQILYEPETSWGENPGSLTKKLRVTDFDVQLTKDTFQSNELTPTRQIIDLRHGTPQVRGNIPIEFSYGAFDDFLESLMFNSWSGNELTVGTTQKSFTIERGFLDINKFHIFTGCVVNSFSLTINPNAIVTGSFEIIGKNMSTSDTSYEVSGGATTPASNPPFDSYSGALYEGSYGGSYSQIAIVTAIDLNITNNIDPALVVGKNEAIALDEGFCVATGTATMFFSDNTMLDKFINEEYAMLKITLSDGTNTFTIEFPKIKYTGGDVTTSGAGPITIRLPFQSIYDEVTGTSVKFIR